MTRPVTVHKAAKQGIGEEIEQLGGVEFTPRFLGVRYDGDTNHARYHFPRSPLALEIRIGMILRSADLDGDYRVTSVETRRGGLVVTASRKPSKGLRGLT